MSHQHGPNCNHDHDHGHSHGPPGGGMPPMMQVQVDPKMQALLDAQPVNTVEFALVEVPVPNTQPPQTQQMVVCVGHKNPICEECDVNFAPLNYMQQFMRSAPPEAIPPPPSVAPAPGRAEAIKGVKDQGNVISVVPIPPTFSIQTAFKAGNIGAAVQNYSRSADMALSRPPWELAQVSRDEAAVALCNRSAAFALANAWANALADAEVVVALKRSWTKGHFRKARALVGLGRLEAARDAIIDGLQFEPEDKDLNQFLAEVDAQMDEEDKQ